MEMRLHNDQMIVAHGKLVVVGRQPDGDSIRFIPNKMQTLQQLPHATRLRPAKDGSVQLRLDAIDAPETHFAGQAQPYGAVARNALLKGVGFKNIDIDSAGTVIASVPASVPATILINVLDPYGRPVSYILPGAAADLIEGSLVDAGTSLLARSVNMQLLKDGAAYITLYNSVAPEHRDYIRKIATAAHDAKRGVWKLDTTLHFKLVNHASIGPGSGILILPKLFRRCTDYLAALDAGFTGTFPVWMEGTAANIYHSEDDSVIRVNGKVVKLHTLIKQRGTVITTALDPLTDVFIEQ